VQPIEQFPPRRFLVGALALFLAAEAFIVAVNLSPLIEYWGPQKLFDVNGEGTIPAWMSSAALLLIAIGAAACGAVEVAARTGRFRAVGWFGFASLFVLLSLDEVSSMHELVGNYTAIHIGSFDALPGVFMWVVVLVPVALVVAAVLVAWFVVAIGWRDMSARLALAALAVWIMVPILETLDPALGAPRWLIVLEESTEVVGEALMLCAIWGHLLRLQAHHLVSIRVLGRDAMERPAESALDPDRSSVAPSDEDSAADSDRQRPPVRRRVA
jgi:hypothetical protein